MKIQANERVHLSAFEPDDKLALVEHLQAKEIYDCTLRIPYPYKEADADAWLEIAARATVMHGRPVYWAIREPGGRLIGCCGLDGLESGKSHRAEIGYWVAKPYWGHGIATDAVRALSRWAFEELGLVKLTAWIFAFNQASARVLEKSGFEQEGYLKQHYRKDGNFIDARLFGRLRDSGG